MPDQNATNEPFDKEKAEGSRETVNQALDKDQQGVSNRSAGEEESRHEKVPPRGHAVE